MLIADDLDKLLDVLPHFIKQQLQAHPKRKDLIEIVMDLGRRPEARFPNGPEYLSPRSIAWHDLDYSIRRIGNFSDDNRSGIERTLHRISSIRNRQGSIIGLTCRVGRAIFGTISIARDLLETGQSILLLGKPGVGKTTAIREIARVLADEMEKRVVIIDTSNEIAGDGDIPHPAIGRARRMQVARPEFQHQVMIEAVENHMPEVIIIDEIGTELESLAARTIAERGVQLVGTAHGNFLESVIKNPILSDLIGGIQYVTLGDDEAKRRGTQKSILERKAAPAFQIAIEIHERTNWIIHERVDETVDQILQGSQTFVQKRELQGNGKIKIDCQEINNENLTNHLKWQNKANWNPTFQVQVEDKTGVKNNHKNAIKQFNICKTEKSVIDIQPMLDLDIVTGKSQILTIYCYAVDIPKISSIISEYQLPMKITQEIGKADVILSLRSQVKQNEHLRKIAHNKALTIYTIHNNTIQQISRALRKMLSINRVSQVQWFRICHDKNLDEIDALNETRWAIEKVVLQKKQPVELLSRLACTRKLQHELVKFYSLKARSFGEEPYRKLRIYPN